MVRNKQFLLLLSSSSSMLLLLLLLFFLYVQLLIWFIVVHHFSAYLLLSIASISLALSLFPLWNSFSHLSFPLVAFPRFVGRTMRARVTSYAKLLIFILEFWKEREGEKNAVISRYCPKSVSVRGVDVTMPTNEVALSKPTSCSVGAINILSTQFQYSCDLR